MSKMARARFVKNLKIAEMTKKKELQARKEAERKAIAEQIAAARDADANASQSAIAALESKLSAEAEAAEKKWSSWEAEQEAKEAGEDEASRSAAAMRRREEREAARKQRRSKGRRKPRAADAAGAPATATAEAEVEAEMYAIDAELDEQRAALAAAQAAQALKAMRLNQQDSALLATQRQAEAAAATLRAAEQSCAFEGWTVIESESKPGKYYYWHDASGHTCWAAPSAEDDAAARAEADEFAADAESANAEWESSTPVEQLVIAAASDDSELVAALLAADAASSATTVDSDGSTALHTAAHYGNVASLRVLLGCDDLDGAGAGPEELAAASAVSRLSAEELDARCRCVDAAGCTALHWACAANEYDACALLVALGAQSIDVVNEAGETALHAAAAHGCIDCLGLLLAAGANPNLCNSAGQSAAHVFVSAAGGDAEDAEALAYIFGMGGDAKALDHEGRTPLYYAA